MRQSTATSRVSHVASAILVAALSPGLAASTETAAEELVKKTTERVIDVLKIERQVIDANPGRIYEIVDEYVIPHFDFERMSQRVLGKFWHRASDDQKTRFLKEFQTLLVRTYATALREYSDQKIEFLPARPRNDSEVSVRTQIIRVGGPPIPIQYEMYKGETAWKVYDVSIDGVSLVINYRSTFASEIRSNGLDGLIERLVAHNQQKR